MSKFSALLASHVVESVYTSYEDDGYIIVNFLLSKPIDVELTAELGRRLRPYAWMSASIYTVMLNERGQTNMQVRCSVTVLGVLEEFASAFYVAERISRMA